MSASPLPRVLFVGPSAPPARLGRWVQHADALSPPPEVPGTTTLWLIDGTDDAHREQALAALHRSHAPEARPWLLWLPRSRHPEGARDEAWAWEHGAQDILRETDPEAFWRRQLAAAQSRLAGASGFARRLADMRRDLHSLQASVDNIPAPIFLKDTAGRYTGCNQAFCHFLGLTREQIIGKTVFDVAPPELAAVYHRADLQLLAAGQRQIYDAQVRWSDGTLRDVTFFKAVFHDGDGAAAGQAGAIFDITERRQLEQELRLLAEKDELTGVANRRTFLAQAGARLQATAAGNEVWLAVMIDVDHFKTVNDGLGHAAGDLLLQHVATELRGQVRSSDLLARWGGDEFAMLLAGDAPSRQLVARLVSALASMPLRVGEHDVPVSISVGGASFRCGDVALEEAMKRADQALYEAKRLGRNRLVLRHEAGADAGPPAGLPA